MVEKCEVGAHRGATGRERFRKVSTVWSSWYDIKLGPERQNRRTEHSLNAFGA